MAKKLTKHQEAAVDVIGMAHGAARLQVDVARAAFSINPDFSARSLAEAHAAGKLDEWIDEFARCDPKGCARVLSAMQTYRTMGEVCQSLLALAVAVQKEGSK